jgi:hypothetical protein
MCTKPIGARPEEGMYSWTPKILQDQIAHTFRKTRADATAQTLRDSEERIESVKTISDRTFPSLSE